MESQLPRLRVSIDNDGGLFIFPMANCVAGLSYGGAAPHLKDLGPVYMKKFLKVS